jgi:hypothetical protein
MTNPDVVGCFAKHEYLKRVNPAAAVRYRLIHEDDILTARRTLRLGPECEAIGARVVPDGPVVNRVDCVHVGEHTIVAQGRQPDAA